MTTITLEKAQQDLPLLVNRALAGEEIVILVRLAPSPTDTGFDEANARRRGYGSMNGQFEVPDSFFEPLPEDVQKRWEGRHDSSQAPTAPISAALAGRHCICFPRFFNPRGQSSWKSYG